MPNYTHIQPTLAVQFAKDSTATNPIPPIGQAYDGRQGQDLSALYPATQQSTTITLGGSTVEGDVHTLTITPVLMATGSAWADELGPISVEFETGAAPDDILDAVAKGLVQALTDSQTIVDLQDLAKFQRIAEIVQWSSPGTDQIELVSTQAGATFSYSLTSTGAVTETSVTTGTADEPLYPGFAAYVDSYKPDGTPVLRPLQAGDADASRVVLVMDSMMCEALEPGEPFRRYKRKRDVPWRYFGSASGYGEGAAPTIGAPVFVRLQPDPGGVGIPGALSAVDAGGGQHLQVPWTFLRVTDKAGAQAIDIPHP
jgi:hypothetical protein